VIEFEHSALSADEIREHEHHYGNILVRGEADQSSPTPMPKMARPCVIKTLFVTTLHNAIA
jgi:hypothetical protein